MPLSEQEQRLLDEMERQLLRNDADVVSAPSPDRTLSYRNLVVGALLLIAGIGGLVAGVVVGDVLGIVIGVLGFGLMFAGVLLALAPSRSTEPTPGRTREGAKNSSSSQPAFMDRMNERWERRQDGR